MKNQVRCTAVVLRVTVSVPAETDDKQLTAALPETLCEVLPALIDQPDDVEVLQIDDTILTDKRLTLSEKAYLSALLSMDREEKQLVLQNLRSGQVESEKLTDGRLINDINQVDSIAQKLDIQI